MFTSKDANLNKAHIRHLEGRLITLAKTANRAEIENGNVGSMPPLSEPDTAEAETFLAEMLLIYPVLGVQVFQKPSQQPSSTVVLHLNGKDTNATGNDAPDGFVVHSGSLARAETVPSIHAYGLQLRDALVESSRLVPNGVHLRLTEDYVFSSPSTAAMVMLGRTSNGRIEWKTDDGRTLKQLQSEDTSTTADDGET